jgi:hypothetical protein
VDRGRARVAESGRDDYPRVTLARARFVLVFGFTFQFEPDDRGLAAAIARLARTWAANVQDGARGETRRAKAAEVMRFSWHLQRGGNRSAAPEPLEQNLTSRPFADEALNARGKFEKFRPGLLQCFR